MQLQESSIGCMESRGKVTVVCSGERVVLMKSESLSADLKANGSGA